MYITFSTNAPIHKRQYKFEDLFDSMGNLKELPSDLDTGLFKDTIYRTIQVDSLNPTSTTKVVGICTLFSIKFLNRMSEYKDQDMHSHYTQFKIPKRSGGLRTINAPDEDLKELLSDITKYFMANHVLAHNCAYAYVSGRSCLDAVQRHQKTGHQWFLKIDLHDFFGSCTYDIMKKNLNEIPYFRYMSEEAFDALMHIATLDGGLPQGTPLSPWLTNQIMVPIDVLISNEMNKRHMTYTRYADDMIISADSRTACTVALKLITDILKGTGFEINEKKTRIGSIYGKNWNLGLMLNKDGNITVGHKKKERFRATMHNFIMNSNEFSVTEASELLGLYSYYHQIEPEYFDSIVNKLNSKYNVDALKMLKDKIKGIQI